MRATACVFLLTLSCAAHAADKPEDFTVRFKIQTAPDAGLQRLALPKEALTALQTSSGADLRVFNGDGQPVPVAQVPLRSQAVAVEAKSWPVYPVMATTPQQQNPGGLSLRIEETAGRRVVQVEGGGDAKLAAPMTKQIATLVDTRPLKGALAELAVDADLIPGQAVALTVTASKDLKNWRTLAQDMPVFRFGSDATAPGSLRVPLNGANVDGDYLRISWPSEAVFTLRGVSVRQSAGTAAPQRVSVPLLAATDSKELIYPLPFATPLQALDIRPAGPNTLVPLRISGRSVRGEPWRLLASGVAYRIRTGGAESLGPPVELNGVSVRELRIETDATGFATAPQVSALLLPQEVVFIASGAAPFTLALGRTGAEPTRLPLASLIPGYTEGAEQKLPTASVDPASVVVQQASGAVRVSSALGAPSPRSLVLWAVLIGGVLALGGVAWAVMRQMKSAEKPQV